MKIINGLIEHVKQNRNSALKYLKLDKYSTQLVVNSDTSFTTNKNGPSKVWYLMFMTYKDKETSLIDYASNKSKRVVRSVLGSEIFGLADASDSEILIQHDQKQML